MSSGNKLQQNSSQLVVLPFLGGSRGPFFRPRASNLTRQEIIYGKIPVACLIIKYPLSPVQLPAESGCSFT